MKFDPDKHRRRSIRLKGYDYSQAGAYFITLCTRDRACLFGEVVDGEMRWNDIGRMVKTIWDELPNHDDRIGLDAFVVMPNHVHGIIVITHPIAPRPNITDSGVIRGAMNRAPTVGEIVRAFKSRVTITIHRQRDAMGTPVWQRNYYEHIIRDEPSLNRIREYIVNNPTQWLMDRENPVSGTHPGAPRPSDHKDEPWRI